MRLYQGAALLTSASAELIPLGGVLVGPDGLVKDHQIIREDVWLLQP